MKKTIKTILALMFIGFLMTGCVTKKKLKESQELQSAFILDQTETKFINSTKRLESKIAESLSLDFNEKLKSIKESTSTNENESSVVSGTMTAEEGKEKVFTDGNTTIKSNGVNLTFEIKNTKQKLQESETLISELTQTVNELKTFNLSLKNELNEFKNEQLKKNETFVSKSETKNKVTNKKSLSFGSIITIIILIILTLLFFVYRSKMITLFKKFTI